VCSLIEFLIWKQKAALFDICQLICNAVDSGLSTRQTELDDKKSDSLLRQCCVIGCTEDDLATFCRTDRNQMSVS
jgi:hypothetical protein